MLEENTILFITLAAIVILLIAYNVSLVKVKRHIDVLDSAVMDTLSLVAAICQTMSSSLKEIRKAKEKEEAEKEKSTKQDIRG